ncbi:glutaredoxin family protein [Candidatus Curtissbacteria bacterium]|nr:glutaredoxin family protein [Candidatus Curtissbacteria bacterium]
MAKVTMYTTTTCPFCKMQKEYLASKNIPYEEILVDEKKTRIDEALGISS